MKHPKVEFEILSNEKNHIYVGMAKEAAHQLGTPISSLLGWLKLLESGNSNRKEIYDYMGEDIKKLENVSHKFNKIGSRPKLIKIDLIKSDFKLLTSLDSV